MSQQPVQVEPAPQAAEIEIANDAKPRPPTARLNAESKARREARKAARSVHAAGGPPTVRLLNRHEVLQIAGVKSYRIIWQRMRAGTFPRCLVVEGRSKWRSDEIQAWIDALPRRKLKGDAAPSNEESEI